MMIGVQCFRYEYSQRHDDSNPVVVGFIQLSFSFFINIQSLLQSVSGSIEVRSKGEIGSLVRSNKQWLRPLFRKSSSFPVIEDMKSVRCV